ncbi:MAG TPA: hypothetical protein VM818_14860 [Vicinamibacterales bacterium]|nr:hypothetical protein [Vicinamibacterales bacterium]
MTKRALALFVTLLAPGVALAQIRVHPTGVNVNAQGATTVFLTFGGLSNHTAAESEWCGRLISAAPAVGLKCDPTTVYGRLPARFLQTRPTGVTGLADIMSIPPSVTRRAYQAAEAGETAGFFYVRHFVGSGGLPDQYVFVTCRLAGGGARVPLSLVDVKLAFAVETPVLFVNSGDELPALKADITYTGTGRLQGRWEVVLPGEELPAPTDLLTEATLPIEQRGTQRRYTELERFNVLLPPTGRIQLSGPSPRVIPTSAEGQYMVLLRIETSADKEGDSSLAASGAGLGVVRGGAVAGFPLPPLRYVVGRSTSEATAAASPGRFELVRPLAGSGLGSGSELEFAWIGSGPAALYRLEVEGGSGQIVFAALVHGEAATYRAPSWLADRTGGGPVRWRVVALSATGRTMRSSEWRSLDLATREP